METPGQVDDTFFVQLSIEDNSVILGDMAQDVVDEQIYLMPRTLGSRRLGLSFSTRYRALQQQSWYIIHILLYLKN